MLAVDQPRSTIYQPAKAMAYYQFTPSDGEPYGSFETFHYDLASFQDCKGADGLFYVFQSDFTPDGGLLEEDLPGLVGFYWQSCFPGCLPDSDPVGPFQTEAEAIADANS